MPEPTARSGGKMARMASIYENEVFASEDRQRRGKAWSVIGKKIIADASVARYARQCCKQKEILI